MEKMKEVVLTLECRNMTDAKRQRIKLDETLVRNGWYLYQHQSADKDIETVTTKTVWTQIFLAVKPQPRIHKQIQNLLKRATEYAGIIEYKAYYTIEGDEYSF